MSGLVRSYVILPPGGRQYKFNESLFSSVNFHVLMKNFT